MLRTPSSSRDCSRSSTAYYTQLEAAAEPATVPKLDLNALVSTYERMQSVEKEKIMIEQPETIQQEVFYVKKNSPQQYRHKAGESSQGWEGAHYNNQRQCWACHETHPNYTDCSFYGTTCSKCQGRTTTSRSAVPTTRRSASGVELKRLRQLQDDTQATPRTFNIQASDASEPFQSKRRFCVPKINGTPVKLQHDTGSDWTVISRTNWEAVGSPQLTPCKRQAISASGEAVKLLGIFKARLHIHGRGADGVCYVSAADCNVLGADWIDRLDLWCVPIPAYCHTISSSKAPARLQSVRVVSPHQNKQQPPQLKAPKRPRAPGSRTPDGKISKEAQQQPIRVSQQCSPKRSHASIRRSIEFSASRPSRSASATSASTAHRSATTSWHA